MRSFRATSEALGGIDGRGTERRGPTRRKESAVETHLCERARREHAFEIGVELVLGGDRIDAAFNPRRKIPKLGAELSFEGLSLSFEEARQHQPLGPCPLEIPHGAILLPREQFFPSFPLVLGHRQVRLDHVKEQIFLELRRSGSPLHRFPQSYIGGLIEAYALERGIDLSPYGAWTLKNAPKQSGLEPDECYLVGDQSKDTPDLAIEVVWTSGGIDKLEIYRRLGVREVWIWQDSQIEVHVLRQQRYELAEKSALFPDLDVPLLASFLDRPTALQAVKAFREALRG